VSIVFNALKRIALKRPALNRDPPQSPTPSQLVFRAGRSPLSSIWTRDGRCVALHAGRGATALSAELLGGLDDRGKNLVEASLSSGEKLLDPGAAHEWDLRRKLWQAEPALGVEECTRNVV